MSRARFSKLFKEDYMQTIIMIIIIILVVVIFWYGLSFIFQTAHPLYAVEGSSMETTLYEGDLILVRGVQNACEIYAAQKDVDPPGDIIVFRDPWGKLIVHRAVEKRVAIDGSCILRTQGDNRKTNPSQDPWEVKENDIVGKYTGTKVPLLGHVALFFGPFEVKVAFIMLWIILLVILELVPLFRRHGQQEMPTSLNPTAESV